MPPPPSTRTILKSANLTSKPARPRLPTWDVRHLRSLWRLTTTTNWLTRKCPKTASAVLTRQAKVRGLLGDPAFRFELALAHRLSSNCQFVPRGIVPRRLQMPAAQLGARPSLIPKPPPSIRPSPSPGDPRLGCIGVPTGGGVRAAAERRAAIRLYCLTSCKQRTRADTNSALVEGEGLAAG